MAKQIITRITDDLDGGDADETLLFGIDGVAYEIDLSGKNASKLRDFLATYQQAGTRVGRLDNASLRSGRQGVARTSSGSQHPNFLANKELNGKIRVWATQHGYDLNVRGRIPQHIVEAYHSGTPAVGFKVAEPEAEPVAVPKRRRRPADKVPA